MFIDENSYTFTEVDANSHTLVIEEMIELFSKAEEHFEKKLLNLIEHREFHKLGIKDDDIDFEKKGYISK